MQLGHHMQYILTHRTYYTELVNMHKHKTIKYKYRKRQADMYTNANIKYHVFNIDQSTVLAALKHFTWESPHLATHLSLPCSPFLELLRWCPSLREESWAWRCEKKKIPLALDTIYSKEVKSSCRIREIHMSLLDLRMRNQPEK